MTSVTLDDLLPGPEQVQLADGLRDYLAAEMKLARLHDGSGDRPGWRGLAELGAFSLALPGGASVLEEAMLHGLFGRFLLGPAALATTLAAHALQDAGLQEGTRRAGMAMIHADGCLLLDAADAAYIVLLGAGRLEIHPAAAFANRTPRPCYDDGVVLERATLPVASPLPADAAGLRPRALLLMAAYLAGIAAATRDMAVAYATLREQFGKPIGSFQAIKHHCANMAVAAEQAGALSRFAAIALRDAWPDAAFQIAAAALIAGEAASGNSALNIQVHGGMGYTWECDAQLFLKRTHVMRVLAGDLRREIALSAGPA